jgi:hypothetical protein
MMPMNNDQENMKDMQDPQEGGEGEALQFDPQQYPDLQAFEPGDDIQLMITGKVTEGTSDGMLGVQPDQVMVKGNAAAQQVKKMQRMGNEGNSSGSQSSSSAMDY